MFRDPGSAWTTVSHGLIASQISSALDFLWTIGACRIVHSPFSFIILYTAIDRGDAEWASQRISALSTRGSNSWCRTSASRESHCRQKDTSLEVRWAIVIIWHALYSNVLDEPQQCEFCDIKGVDNSHGRNLVVCLDGTSNRFGKYVCPFYIFQ